MWSRLVLSGALATMAVLVLGMSALAGGWAITTMDSLPPGGFQAGETYRLGYMIRQHGQTPFAGAKSSIRIQARSGESHVFPGVPEGAPGHYVSEVRFPAAGEWIWEVDQSPFAPQKLGTITVPRAAGVSAPDPVMVREPAAQPALAEATRTEGSVAGLIVALALAALLATTLIAWRVVAFTRRAHATAPRHPTGRARAS